MRTSSKSRGLGVAGGAGVSTLRGAGMGVEVPYRTLGTGVRSKLTTGGTNNRREINVTLNPYHDIV